MSDPYSRDPFIITCSGKKFHLLHPRYHEFDIADIAHALSNLCRYTGHCKTFYSVAEHSIHVSNLVRPSYALQALLHDAPEAYISDISRSLKYQTQAGAYYQEIEERIWRRMARVFGVFPGFPEEVKWADDIMLLVEWKHLFPGVEYPDREFYDSQRGRIPDVKIQCWSPEVAEIKFLERYLEICKARGEKIPRFRRPLVGRKVDLEGIDGQKTSEL